MGKEAFITTLNNANLQLEVMEREPATVEIALGHTIKLRGTFQTVSNNPEAGQAKRQPRNFFGVTGQDDQQDNVALHKRVGQPEEALELATKGVLVLAAGGRRAAPQNAAATAGANQGAASQKSAS